MRKIVVLSFMLVFLVASFALTQQRTVTGIVTSAQDGQGVPGASVVIKGTTIGTITDFEGEYSIDVPSPNTVLMFSFIGLRTQEALVGDRSEINVVLDVDYFGLDEVVISGLAAETPRSKLAVSVERIGEERISTVPARSAASALQGKVAGVTVINPTGEPGGTATILVRGATQIAGSQDPLIIVDGGILEGALGDINVNDIESFEVVKGASASALYGSRAGNGVIVITTKRGRTAADGVSDITVRNEFGRNQLAKYYDLAKHHEFVLANDWQNYTDYTRYAGVTYPDGYRGGFDISGSRRVKYDQYMDNPFGRLINHESEMFPGNNFMTNYVSLTGRSGNTNYFTSFENFSEGGLLFETGGYQRNSFRINLDHRFSDRLMFNASNLYSKGVTNRPGGDSKYNGGNFFNLLVTSPDADLFAENPDGQPYLFLFDPWQATTENPLYNLWKKQDDNERNRLLGSYNLRYEVASFLNFEAKYSMELSTSSTTSLDPYDTFRRAGEAGAVYSEGEYYKFNSKLLAQTAQMTANLNRQIGDFNTRARLSYLYENRGYESFSATGYKFSVQGIPSFAATSPDERTASSSQNEIIAENLFGILYIDYRDKYIFDGMVRRDGSSMFGENERYKNYFRVSGAWRISQDFTIPGVQELKIRSAYGTAGQRPHLFSMQYEVLGFAAGKPAGKIQLGNKDLKPSLSTEIEAGLNVDFLTRFSTEFVYSKTVTSDQFLNVPLSSHLGGWSRQWRNAGTLESKVLEAMLDAQIIRSSDLTWNMTLIFDRARTVITKLDVPPYQTGPQGQEADKTFYIKEGEPFGVIWGDSWVTSLDQMKMQISDDESINDYTINSDGYVIRKGTEGTINELPFKVKDEDGNNLYSRIGNTQPDFKMGFSSTLNYKGFGIYTLWEWRQGGDIYNRSAQWLTRDNRHGMMDQAGKPENEKKTIPYYKAFYDVNNVNSFWVEDGTFVKLRELAVYYDVPAATLRGVLGGAMKNIRVSLVGRNLFTFTNYSGYDPEVQTTDFTQYFMYDFMGYPNYRTISGSLELKF